MLLAQDGPRLVELGQADAADALADAVGGQLAVGHAPGQCQVDAGVEQQAGVFHQCLLPAALPQVLGVGPREQEQGIGQGGVGGQAQLVAVGDAEEGVAADDVTLAVRHLQADAGEAAVLFDDAAQDARRHEQGGGVGLAEEALEVGGRQGGHGNLVHGQSFLAEPGGVILPEPRRPCYGPVRVPWGPR
jgi:hypothetical protein